MSSIIETLVSIVESGKTLRSVTLNGGYEIEVGPYSDKYVIMSGEAGEAFEDAISAIECFIGLVGEESASSLCQVEAWIVEYDERDTVQLSSGVSVGEGDVLGFFDDDWNWQEDKVRRREDGTLYFWDPSTDISNYENVVLMSLVKTESECN